MSYKIRWRGKKSTCPSAIMQACHQKSCNWPPAKRRSFNLHPDFIIEHSKTGLCKRRNRPSEGRTLHQFCTWSLQRTFRPLGEEVVPQKGTNRHVLGVSRGKKIMGSYTHHCPRCDQDPIKMRPERGWRNQSNERQKAKTKAGAYRSGSSCNREMMKDFPAPKRGLRL